MKLLFENWRAYCEEDFVMLYESYEKGTITEERLLMLWEENVNREYEQMLNEGIMDILAIGYEKGKQLVGKAKEAYDNAMAKVSDFYMKLLNQAWLLTQKVKQGVQKVASVLKSVYDKVSAFCDKHPIFCKVVKIFLAMLAVASVMVLFSNGAEAAVASPGGTVISDTGIDAMKGVLGQMAETKDMTDQATQESFVQAFNWLEKAHASKDVVDLASSGKEGSDLVLRAYKAIQGVVNDPEVSALQKNIFYQNIASTGEKVYVTTTTITKSLSGYDPKTIEFSSLAIPR